ncbi:hypothetical protein NLI96_g11732 [Meripilus lineatus]|uniref:Peptidase M12A domain-containing protein n=1 Tax=Meripilus lineatus TaxID=2056292 RepID=A0AAD5Y8V8_9APHY|nr:hypothetical protein NLI96_g11732 [Physisporinus lineatus]
MCLTHAHFITRDHALEALATSIPSWLLLGALQTGTLWDHHEQIEISFMSGSGTRHQRRKVKRIFQEIFRFTNLTLLWVNDGDGHVRIAFDDGFASQSTVGTKCLWVPKNHWTMNLQSIRPNDDCPSHMEEQTIKHECMHLLAFVHEHQVPERLKHYLFNQSKVDKYYKRQLGMSEEDIKTNITNLWPPGKLENHSPFDPKSITQYQFPGHLIQNGRGTPRNTELSPTDKAVLVLNYARLAPDPLVSGWTVAYAADVIGIKNGWREKIIAATHPHDVRRLYSEWSASPQASAFSTRKGPRGLGEAVQVAVNCILFGTLGLLAAFKLLRSLL